MGDPGFELHEPYSDAEPLNRHPEFGPCTRNSASWFPSPYRRRALSWCTSNTVIQREVNGVIHHRKR
jgi:hypothetical protein